MDKLEEELEHQGIVSRVWHSIRTQYSMATAMFLMLALSVFYIGGRIVLVHMIRETEDHVRRVGDNISSMAYRHAEKVRRAAAEVVKHPIATAYLQPERLMTEVGYPFSFVAVFTGEGRYINGAVRMKDGCCVECPEATFADYSTVLKRWMKSVEGRSIKEMMLSEASTGILRINGGLHYGTIVPNNDFFLLFGLPFEASILTDDKSSEYSGVEVRFTSEKERVELSSTKKVRRTLERSEYGISPMFSEAMNFYTGGFWKIGNSDFEAVYAIRDIAGNAVSTITVSIPKTFASVTKIAVGRLSFFLAMGGIFLVLPIFWFQSRVLLNPLTKMTAEVVALGQRMSDTDCPRLDWHGKDEFAQLALSVNRMLETISSRTLAVAQSEVRQRALIETIPDALVVFDRQHRLVTIVKDTSGRDSLPFAIPGQRFPEIVFGQAAREQLENRVDKVFADGAASEPMRLTMQHAPWVPANVPSRHFEIRLVKMDELFVLALIRDISVEVAEHNQLLAVREQLKEGEKRESLALLAAGIAHDVNNVLAIIANTVSATWPEHTAATEENAVATIADALKRGRSMMRELIDYAGESKMQLVRTSPRAVIDECHTILEGLVANRVILECNVPDDLPDIDCCSDQLWKVFMNIVKNAVEAMGGNPGRITISAEAHELTRQEMLGYRASATLKPGRGVVFTIADDGPGIPAELCKRLFDPYVSSKSIGRGLGLAITASVVDSHSGGIRVDSVIDKGTTFSLFLPESRLPKPVAAASEAAAEVAHVNHGTDVLVIDDEAAILKTSSMLLRALKYTPRTASNRNEALEAMRLHGAALAAVLLDASIGDVDTARLANVIRKNLPGVPLVIASGSQEDHIRRLFADAHIDAFLGKPYMLGELKAVLEKVAGKRV